MRRVLPLAVFSALAVFFALALLRGKDTASPLTGHPAPTLPIAVEKPFAVNFFASWCLSCRAEQKVLEGLALETGLPLYGIAYKDAPAATQAFLAEHGNPFTAVIPDPSGRIGIDWGVTGVPETFIVDARGRVTYRLAGPLTPEIYARDVQQAAKAAKE